MSELEKSEKRKLSAKTIEVGVVSIMKKYEVKQPRRFLSKEVLDEGGNIEAGENYVTMPYA
jgi:hypothetical protein